jgi:hypothetical protein
VLFEQRLAGGLAWPLDADCTSVGRMGLVATDGPLASASPGASSTDSIIDSTTVE